jgi:hypothetical protein
VETLILRTKTKTKMKTKAQESRNLRTVVAANANRPMATIPWQRGIKADKGLTTAEIWEHAASLALPDAIGALDLNSGKGPSTIIIRDTCLDRTIYAQLYPTLPQMIQTSNIIVYVTYSTASLTYS